MTEQTTSARPQVFCRACGDRIDAEAEICPKCGVRAQRAPLSLDLPTAPNGKSKIAAGILGIFLGAFGIHKFYLGQIGMGILYLVFCWTLIPGIVGFIEGILYLTMSDADFAAKYGGS